MGFYYVVGEPFSLPVPDSPDYLSRFPSDECFFFEMEQDAIVYARHKNKSLSNAVSPVFKVKFDLNNDDSGEKISIPLEKGTLQARKAILKRKYVKSASLTYYDPNIKEIKYARILTQSIDKSPSSVKLEASESSTGFITIMLAALTSTLFFSLLFCFTSLPVLFINTLAKAGIIFVLPSTVLIAKIWFAVSLGTVTTGALMGLYFGVVLTLKLLDDFVRYVKGKYEQYQDRNSLSFRADNHPSYIQKLSSFFNTAAHSVSNQFSVFPAFIPSMQPMRQKIKNIFGKEKKAEPDPAPAQHTPASELRI